MPESRSALHVPQKELLKFLENHLEKLNRRRINMFVDFLTLTLWIETNYVLLCLNIMCAKDYSYSH